MARAYPGSFTGKKTTRTRLSLPGLNVDWFRRFRAAAVAICSLAPLLRGEGRGEGLPSANAVSEVSSAALILTRNSSCTRISTSPRKERGEVGEILRHRADPLRDLLDNFADLVFADDQGRRQRQRIASDTQHQVVVVERAVQAVEPALAGLLRARREIDACGQPDGADVHYIRLALQRHHRVGEFCFEFVGALEQLFVAVDIERGETGSTGQRMRRIGIAVSQLHDMVRAAHEGVVDGVAAGYASPRRRSVGEA